MLQDMKVLLIEEEVALERERVAHTGPFVGVRAASWSTLDRAVGFPCKRWLSTGRSWRSRRLTLGFRSEKKIALALAQLITLEQ